MPKNLSEIVNEPAFQDMLPFVRTFVINTLPEDIKNHPDARYYNVSIEWRGQDSWAVISRSGDVIAEDGTETYEPLPSSRTKRFKKKYRHTIEKAVEIAERLADKTNGFGMPRDVYIAKVREMRAAKQEDIEL